VVRTKAAAGPVPGPRRARQGDHAATCCSHMPRASASTGAVTVRPAGSTIGHATRRTTGEPKPPMLDQ